MIAKIAHYIRDSVTDHNIKVFVREKAVVKFNKASQIIFKVVGATDYILWTTRQQAWDELAITSIKKYITGDGRADKDKVAAHLEAYLGPQTWKYDDESDAAGCGVAWLIENGYVDQVATEEEGGT